MKRKSMLGYPEISLTSPTPRTEQRPCACKIKRSKSTGGDAKYNCEACGGMRTAGEFGLTWCRCKKRWFTRCSCCYKEILPMDKDEEENLAIAILAKELGLE